MKHQVECARFCEIHGAAFGAFDFMRDDEIGHLRKAHAVGVFVQSALYEMIAAKSSFAGFAIDEGVIEALDMTGGCPGFWVQQNGQ